MWYSNQVTVGCVYVPDKDVVREGSSGEISGAEVAGGEGQACWELVSAETSGNVGKGEGFSTGRVEEDCAVELD